MKKVLLSRGQDNLHMKSSEALHDNNFRLVAKQKSVCVCVCVCVYVCVCVFAEAYYIAICIYNL